MAQTFTRLLVHIVFSTKDRQPLITPEFEPELFAYIGGICRSNDSPLLDAGGTSDHLHLLVSLGKTITIADLVLPIKRDSSAWAKTHSASHESFRWQEGYGGFSVGESQVEALRSYFARQKEHHRTQTFKEEFVAILRRYKLNYDEKYIWT